MDDSTSTCTPSSVPDSPSSSPFLAITLGKNNGSTNDGSINKKKKIISPLHDENPKNPKRQRNDHQNNQATTNKSTITLDGSINVLMNLFRNNGNTTASRELVQAALRQILDELSGDNGKEFMYAFATIHGGIQNTIAALKEYPSDCSIQANGLFLLVKIIDMLGSPFAVVVKKAGALPLCKTAMEMFPLDGCVHVNAFALLQRIWKETLKDKNELSACKDFLPFLGHALTASFAQENRRSISNSALVLWKISETLEGRKMILDASIHHQVGDLLIATTDNQLKGDVAKLHLRLFQEHHAGLATPSQINNQQPPRFYY